jgi:sulfur carrier protein ThiS
MSIVKTQSRITVRLPEPLREGRGTVITMNAASLADIIAKLDLADDRDELFNFAVNGDLVLHGEKDVTLSDGDEVEIVVAFAGG